MAVNVTITSSYIIDDFYNRTGGGDIYVYSSGGSGTVVGGGTSLSGLSDVNLGALANNEVLTYNASAAKWTNKGPVLNEASLGTDFYWNADDLNRLDISTIDLTTVQLTGPQGTTGAQGTQGIQGTMGIQGAVGVQGTIGTQGVQGIQGTSIQGIQGVQGTIGIQGTSGDASLGFSILTGEVSLGSVSFTHNNRLFSDDDCSVLGAAPGDYVILGNPIPFTYSTTRGQWNFAWVNSSDNVRIRRIAMTIPGDAGQSISVAGGIYKVMVIKYPT